MTEQSQTVLELPTKSSANSTDKILIISDAASANGGNVALILVSNLFGNSNAVPVGQDNPANSSSWTGPSGTVFFSNTYGYVAIANNTLRRFAIEDF